MPLFAELVGTALLVGVGLSIVILMFGTGSPVPRWLPGPGLRRALTGFLFGCVGATIAVSQVGKHSGAHINPVVTLAFVLLGTLRGRHGLAYVAAQLTGAAIGAVPLLAWGHMGRSVQFGATIPGTAHGVPWALAGEAAATFALIAGLIVFLRSARLRSLTPALFPPLYAVLVFLEAPLSGASTNPARSFGPALIAGEWSEWWVYWIGPALGTILAVGILRYAPLRWAEVEVAKVYHFAHDPHGLWHRTAVHPAKRVTGRD